MARYIVTEKDKIVRTDTYLVRVECENGEILSDLEPRRLFPLSNPNEYITLLDSKEKEKALIKSLASITEESRTAIEDCFGDYDMIPQITAVRAVEDKLGTLKWKVMTDRGEVSFSIRNRHSDIKVLDGNRLFVRDSNDNRYASDLEKLDKASMRLIFSYL